MEENYNNLESNQEQPPKNNKKLFIIILIIVLVLVVLGMGGYFGYRIYSEKKMSGPLSNSEVGNKEEEADSDQEIIEEKTEKTKEEHVSSPDSDGDGLTDRQEKITWKTDPNNLDTDGDGYSDYEEVKGGYNPLGEGKFPTAEEIIKRIKQGMK